MRSFRDEGTLVCGVGGLTKENPTVRPLEGIGGAGVLAKTCE